MELIDTNKNTEQNTDTESKGQSDLIAKVTITKKAENLMSVLLTKVNDGFEFGRLNRHQLMSWILTKFSEDCSDTDIKAIRTDHFDELALLEISIKRFKQAGGLPPELRKLLLAQAGWDDASKKSQKKTI